MRFLLLLFAFLHAACTCGHEEKAFDELAGGQVAYVLTALNGANVDALTFPTDGCGGSVTVNFKNSDDPCLRAHEGTHGEQIAKIEIYRREVDPTAQPWLWQYIDEHYKKGYEHNKFEVEAREVQMRCEALR